MSTSENLELQLQLHFEICILHFAFAFRISHFAFCISHFAFCILHFTKFAGGKTDFCKRINKVDVQLCYVGLQIELRVHLQH